MKRKIDISLLELGMVTEGQDASDALAQVVSNAQQAESLGFKRIWLAEHHNMIGVSTAATAVLIGHVAGKTKTIRVGAGGIMMPNHTPLAIAEQFGTLDILYPGRIDLGLGRAPGTDGATAAALRRNNLNSQHDFPQDITSLQRFFSNTSADAKVRALPGEGRDIPIWILGSSTDSAYLAADLGLPYAFASHFAPAHLFDAARIYRNNFKSMEGSRPHLMVAANVIVAGSDSEAAFLKTSLDQMILGIITGKRTKLPAPVSELPEIFKHADVIQAMSQFGKFTFAGSPSSVEEQLEEFLSATKADELIVTNYIFDTAARFRSFELFARLMSVQPLAVASS